MSASRPGLTELRNPPSLHVVDLKLGKSIASRNEEEGLFVYIWRAWRSAARDRDTFNVFRFDFSDVGKIPSDAITDVIVPLIPMIRGRKKPGYVVLDNLGSGLITNALEVVMSDEGIAAVARYKGEQRWQLFGEPKLREIYDHPWRVLERDPNWVRGTDLVERSGLVHEYVINGMHKAGLAAKTTQSHLPWYRSITTQS